MAVIVGAHADKIEILARIGFFDMVNGSITVHFRPDGSIAKIERNSVFSVT